jgi:hypothetical protein
MTRRSWILILCLVAVVGAACGSDGGAPQPGASDGSRFGGAFADAKAYPVFASSEVVVGENRFLVGLLDTNDAPIGSAGITMHIAFYDLAESETEAVFESDMEFIETIPGERGLYKTTATFDSAGRWGAEVSVAGDGLDETVNAAFDVAESGTTPAIGDPAPPSDSLTADDVAELSEITTDPEPDATLYELSIEDALKQRKPFVVVFSTPKFCTSQVCGPTLNIVKSVAADLPKVRFIHVEVYKNLDDPSNLLPVPAVSEWGLPSEPWVFVVDARGLVAAKYEGTVTGGELAEALETL